MTTQKMDMLEKGAIVQRDRKTYAVAPHIPGGIILDPDVLHKIADVAKKYQAQALKLTMAQRIAIVGIKEEDIDKVWEELGMDKGHAIGLCVRSIKICPATHFCKRAQQDGVTLGLALDERYHGMELPSKFKIAVSGCVNACTEPVLKDIGIIGLPKGFTVLMGGNGGVKPRLGNEVAQGLNQEEVLALVDRIVTYYKANANKNERLGRMIDRLGLETVQGAIL